VKISSEFSGRNWKLRSWNWQLWKSKQ